MPTSVASHFMPPAATEIASGVDSLYAFLLWASFISCVLVIGGLIYFAVKYRRRSDNDNTPYISHNSTLEFLWSFIPFVIFMIVFVWGWIIYAKLRTFPENALEVQVQAQKWSWTFTYKSGRSVGGDLYVPVNQDVRLVMGSTDVIHSFFIPAFRNKQDVVPGRYTSLWFRPDVVGEFQVFCAEYCGDKHSGMLAKIHVLPKEQFEEWLANDPYKGLSLAEVGQKVFTSRCVACHTLTDQSAIGPGWKGMFGKMEKETDGREMKIDENYIRQKMMNPAFATVAAFADKKGVMPTFAGQLNEQEISGVIEFIKSLK